MQNPTGLTDISNLPADRVKPQEGKFEQSASQSSTMQSVDHENIHREQMPQGSLEHLNAEPGLIAQGVEAVKEFAHKAVEKIEEFVNTTAEKIYGMGDKSTESKGQELKQEVQKRAYLVRKTVSRKLGKRGEKMEKKAGLAAGVAKVYAKEELKSLRRKANRYGRKFERDAEYGLKSLKAEGKRLEGKAGRTELRRRQESDFGTQLREGARNFRREARRMLNDLPRQAELVKQSIKQEVSELKTEFQGKTTESSFPEIPSNKFLLEFSSNEMNGRTGKFRSQPIRRRREAFGEDFSGKSSQWSTEVSAHDWNESCTTANRYIGMLMDMANDYSRRASKQATYAKRRFNRERRNLKL